VFRLALPSMHGNVCQSRNLNAGNGLRLLTARHAGYHVFVKQTRYCGLPRLFIPSTYKS
jgi:hypothetical protein